jgi:pimeloyl-ACP methyl ester carboxylesterase
MTSQNCVLMPGILTDDRLWHHQIPLLSQNFTVSTIILQGHKSLESCITEFLKTAPPTFTLIGFSLGGYGALEVMRQAKERVTGLVLINTTHKGNSPEKQAERKLLIRDVEKGRFRGVTPRLIPKYVAPPHQTRLTPLIVDMAQAIGRTIYQDQQHMALSRPDYTDLLPHITCPTRLIAGAGDTITPAKDLSEAAHLIPKAHFYELSNCAHFAPLERPEKVNEILSQFIKAY